MRILRSASLGKESPKPSNTKVDGRALTAEDIARLLEHAPETYVALLTTAVYTGLRQSELLGLRWRDVDFESGLLRVRFQLSRAQGGRKAECVALKTGAATRDVELRPAVLRALQDKRATRFELSRAHPEDFVFGTRKGTPSFTTTRARGIDVAANAAGLGRVTFHDLRRTYASHLIRSGADAVRAAGQLGHKNPSLTLDTYARDFAEAQRNDDLSRRLDASGFGV